MTMPLVMFGPGGDFVTRLEPQGRDLLTVVGQTMQQQPDTETAGSFAGYSRMPRRKGKQGGSSAQGQAQAVSVGPDGPVQRGVDVFEHAAAPCLPGTYAPAPTDGHPAAAVQQQQALTSSLLEVAHALLETQQQQLRHLQDLARPQPATPATPVTTAAAQTHSMAGPATTITQPAPSARLRFSAGNPTATTTPPHTAAFSPTHPWPPHRPIVIPLSARARQSLAHAQAATRPNPAPSRLSTQALSAAVARTLVLDPVVTGNPSESDHEPYPQTIAHPHPHSRPAPGTRLLAHHAGTGRRIGRQQGHHLRTRRGLDQKRSLAAATQQGTLFGA